MRINIDPSTHRFAELFTQLGLDADDENIDSFLEDHTPLAENIRLADAPFWSTSQAAFLREKILDDADWALVVDQLSEALRAIK